MPAAIMLVPGYGGKGQNSVLLHGACNIFGQLRLANNINFNLVSHFFGSCLQVRRFAGRVATRRQ